MPCQYRVAVTESRIQSQMDHHTLARGIALQCSNLSVIFVFCFVLCSSPPLEINLHPWRCGSTPSPSPFSRICRVLRTEGNKSSSAHDWCMNDNSGRRIRKIRQHCRRCINFRRRASRCNSTLGSASLLSPHSHICRVLGTEGHKSSSAHIWSMKR